MQFHAVVVLLTRVLHTEVQERVVSALDASCGRGPARPLVSFLAGPSHATFVGPVTMSGLTAQWVEVGDVNIDIGANPSAEEAEEAVESGAKKVVDLQDAFRLQEGPSFSKKELMTYLKARTRCSRQTTRSPEALPCLPHFR